MTVYYRPIAQTDHRRSPDALAIAGGWCWFDTAERIERGGSRVMVPVSAIPDALRSALTATRADLCGLSLAQPRLMGILNVTPDSFSDGGKFNAPDAALNHALAMAEGGADILDIGGESTRPGADLVPMDEEIARTRPVIAAIRDMAEIPISIDTRKAPVAQAALEAGAQMINDVSALNFDPELADIATKMEVPICLMHARGEPKSMQERPVYDDVLLDVYDHLAARILVAEAAGLARENIIVDPGIGFGKTLEHNLALLQGLSLFHGLGCPILLGASRKRFIAALANLPQASDRGPGSIAVSLAGLAQGVQIHRVHDIGDTRQAVTLWAAATGTGQ